MAQYAVFCAHDQAVTPHDHLRDPNNEGLLSCTVCGRIVKFPVGLGKDEFVAALKQHAKDNQVAPPPAPLPEPEPLPIAPIGPVKKKNLLEKLFNR